MKFENIDLIDALCRIMDIHTQNYKEDFEMDSKLLRELAVSGSPADQNLLWMSRPNGTYLLREREVFIEGTSENKTWTYYHEQTNDPILAYHVEITGEKDGVVMGNLTELDYAAHVKRLADLTVTIDKVAVTFGDDSTYYLASRIEELDKWDQEKFVAIMEAGCDEVSDIDDLINLTFNLDCYDFIPKITDEYDLGYYYVHEAGIYSEKELGPLANYIDYERFGRDIRMDESGRFTDEGYIRSTGDRAGSGISVRFLWKYLERIFPQIGLRFISIKEHFDNFDTDGFNESLIIPLQNMINALYSKDISRKVSTALKSQMEQGTFQSRNLPYGYKWSEDHSNMVIDDVTAPYVKMIFQWKIEGRSIHSILDELDRLGAPNTELRKRQTGTRTGDGCSCKGWHNSTLYGILTNPHYVGDTVLGRSMTAIYKGLPKKNVKDKDEWIVFPNTHEAIISREDFQKVQDIMTAASEERQTKMQKSEEIRATLVNLFEDKIVCADCGKKMYFHRKRIDKDKRGRWYAFYECSTSAHRRYEKCTPHYIRQDKLEPDVHSVRLARVSMRKSLRLWSSMPSTNI